MKRERMEETLSEKTHEAARKIQRLVRRKSFHRTVPESFWKQAWNELDIDEGKPNFLDSRGKRSF
jgi:hypothetical protein